MSFPLTHPILPANKLHAVETRSNVAKAILEQSLKQAAKKASKQAANQFKSFMSTPIRNRQIMLSNLRHADIKFTNNNMTLRIDKQYFKNLVNRNINRMANNKNNMRYLSSLALHDRK